MKRRTTKARKLAEKKASKLARMRAPGTKSKYQVKQLLKRGRGKVHANWQWWLEREPRAARKAAA